MKVFKYALIIKLFEGVFKFLLFVYFLVFFRLKQQK